MNWPDPCRAVRAGGRPRRVPPGVWRPGPRLWLGAALVSIYVCSTAAPACAHAQQHSCGEQTHLQTDFYFDGANARCGLASSAGGLIYDELLGCSVRLLWGPVGYRELACLGASQCTDIYGRGYPHVELRVRGLGGLRAISEPPSLALLPEVPPRTRRGGGASLRALLRRPQGRPWYCTRAGHVDCGAGQSSPHACRLTAFRQGCRTGSVRGPP